jgi:hypothetical protein
LVRIKCAISGFSLPFSSKSRPFFPALLYFDLGSSGSIHPVSHKTWNRPFGFPAQPSICFRSTARISTLQETASSWSSFRCYFRRSRVNRVAWMSVTSSAHVLARSTRVLTRRVSSIRFSCARRCKFPIVFPLSMLTPASAILFATHLLSLPCPRMAPGICRLGV